MNKNTIDFVIIGALTKKCANKIVGLVLKVITSTCDN